MQWTLISKWARRAGFQTGSLDRRVYVLALGWLISSAGFATVIPFVSIYFYQELGISTSLIGLFFGYTAILRSAPQPFAGWLSDRFGRVPIIAWSEILRGLTFAAVGYAMLRHSGFWTIAAIISFNHIFGSVLQPTANAMAADLVAKKDRIAAFSVLRIAANLGWAIGPALGGFIASRSYALLFFVGGAVACLSGLYYRFALKEVSRPDNVARPDFRLADIVNLRRDKLLFRHCLITFLLLMAVAQLVAPLSLYSTGQIGISRSQLGFLFAVNGFMVVFLQLPVSSLFKRFFLTRQMALGAIIYTIGYFLVGFAGGFWFLVACMIVITTAEMITIPPSTTMVANLSSPAEYGRFMGIYGLFTTAGWSLGPTVGGILLDLFQGHPVLTWGLISSTALIASLLYLDFGRRLSREVNTGREIVGGGKHATS